MDIKIVRLLICVILLALTFPAEAQQAKKIPRIGFLGPGSLSAYSTQIEAFRQGLRDLGRSEEPKLLANASRRRRSP